MYFRNWVNKPLSFSRKRNIWFQKKLTVAVVLMIVIALILFFIFLENRHFKIEGQSRLSAGGEQTCFVTTNKELYCWAYGHSGNKDGSRIVPEKMAVPPTKSVSVGLHHTCAVIEDGGVYCWGSNDYGQLGVGDFKDRLQPTKLAFTNILMVSLGERSTCALDTDGGLYCWGVSDGGNLVDLEPINTRDQEPPTQKGNSNISQGAPPPKVYFKQNTINTPTKVNAAKIRNISTGKFTTYAVFKNGTAAFWAYGGGGAITIIKNLPVKISKVFAREYSPCFILEKGEMLCGDSRSGQILETTRTDNKNETYPFGTLVLKTADFMTDGACAVTKNGAVYCQGFSSLTTLLGMRGYNRLPSDEKDLPWNLDFEEAVEEVSVAQRQICVLSRSGGVTCWNRNIEGEYAFKEKIVLPL